MELNQFIKGVALGGQEFKAVVVDRDRDRAGPVARQAPGPEEPDAFMNKPPFKGKDEQVISFAAGADLQQDLLTPGDTGEVGLAL